ncbi:uncharacterized protein LOC122319633 [Drosophila yakuba]|uniref:uncharacterized protein LOC122319633 n=1 Tax=Drosophila yakuba TaxID=7245 RepID=UPI001C8A5709|nr:uncharacterized protein LOC122319633 [Drosophila yakuba]
MAEISQRVRSLETVLEANTKQLAENTKQLAENTKQLAETTNQVARMTALLEIFVKGKAKNVAVDVAFPVTSEEDLVALDLNISSGSQERYRLRISLYGRTEDMRKALAEYYAETENDPQFAAVWTELEAAYPDRPGQV